jgi:hypothetical protein
LLLSVNPPPAMYSVSHLGRSIDRGMHIRVGKADEGKNLMYVVR